MTATNPYAPPLAHVEDLVPAATPTGEAPLFAVSLTKLCVMSLCTLGLYQVYWHYKHWQRIKLRDGESLVPALRAFFSVLFCYALFKRIRDDEAAPADHDLAAGPLALGWVVVVLLQKLPDPWFMLWLGAVFFLLPVQAYANRINAAVAPDHDRNARLTWVNWVVAAVGGAVLVLAVIGTFAPDA